MKLLTLTSLLIFSSLSFAAPVGMEGGEDTLIQMQKRFAKNLPVVVCTKKKRININLHKVTSPFEYKVLHMSSDDSGDETVGGSAVCVTVVKKINRYY